jgi:hypothetical protein
MTMSALSATASRSMCESCPQVLICHSTAGEDAALIICAYFARHDDEITVKIRGEPAYTRLPVCLWRVLAMAYTISFLLLPERLRVFHVYGSFP